MKLWLADLTYTQQTISSDIFPTATAGLLEYVRQEANFLVTPRIFKFPEALSDAFRNDKPDIVGFSNYMWNERLSLTFAKAIKRHFPEIPIIMGGPNFPDNREEQKEFFIRNPFIDFFIFKEGEQGFFKLVELINEIGFDRDRIFSKFDDLSNLAGIDNRGDLRVSTGAGRLVDLEKLPSPYLSGALDEFFDDRLAPIIQTNRGCPFECTFCTEGQGYWTKVRKKSSDIVNKEIHYIAEKFSNRPGEQKRQDLFISDSNFGMYKEDLKTCASLREAQEKYNYPKLIKVTTGKNKKERVAEGATMLRGTMQVSASVQSMDEEVLESVKRKNISADRLLDVGKLLEGENIMSDVILGLPNDSTKKHFETLEKLVEAGITHLQMYQLMMLPGTEMNSPESRKKFEFTTRYRVLPRCFGYFYFLGEELICSEIEEVGVANSTMSVEDYLTCRKMNLVVAAFYNDRVYETFISFLELLELPVFGWLKEIFDTNDNPLFNQYVSEFLEDTKNELWEDKEKLVDFMSTKENIDHYISGTYGSNLVQKYKALSITKYYETCWEVSKSSLLKYLLKHGFRDGSVVQLIDEIAEYNYYQVNKIFDLGVDSYEGTFSFDIRKLSKLDKYSGVVNSIDDLAFDGVSNIRFEHNKDQKAKISHYKGILAGESIDGIAKILTRIDLKDFYRHARIGRSSSNRVV